MPRAYVESPENSLIVSPDNASRRELNVAVRQELKLIGTLAPEDHTLRVLVQRQDMTGAERSWANHYEVNDVIRYTRGSKAIGIGAGAYASVVAIDPAANLLTVEKANHELATYDPRRLTGVSVYQEIDREFSVGDRIQFTAPDKSLGVANRDLAVIESIHPDGRVTARLDNNRQIEFNAREHRHFDHGYAVTSHSSQGLTAERVLVHADTSVHPDLLNSRFALRFRLARQPRCRTLYRRRGETRSPTGSRCLEDIRSGNQSGVIHHPGNWARAMTVPTMGLAKIAHFPSVFNGQHRCNTHVCKLLIKG